MEISRVISYILIIIGGFIAVYAQASENQNQFLLIGGIVALMIGVYRISKNIPSKKKQDDNNENNSVS